MADGPKPPSASRTSSTSSAWLSACVWATVVAVVAVLAWFFTWSPVVVGAVAIPCIVLSARPARRSDPGDHNRAQGPSGGLDLSGSAMDSMADEPVTDRVSASASADCAAGDVSSAATLSQVGHAVIQEASGQLASIQGAVQMLRRHLGTGDAAVVRYLKLIAEAGDQAGALMRDFCALVDPQQGSEDLPLIAAVDDEIAVAIVLW